MKKILVLLGMCVSMVSVAQIDKEQLALAVSKADEANTEKLKEYIWKRKSDVFVGGQLKLTTLSEFSFDAQGKLQAKVVDAETTVKKKPGLRGMAQKSAAEDKMEYIEKSLALALDYTYMTKGQLLDFFTKATVVEKGDIIEATAQNVYKTGDRLTIQIDAKTKLYLHKKFSSLLGNDQITGEINYEKFSTGTNHGSTTVLNMPAENMKIDAINQDYSKRVK